jgi:hypothetical protein
MVLSVALKRSHMSTRFLRIVRMFGTEAATLDRLAVVDVTGMSSTQLAECVVDTHQLLQAAGCQMLQLAAAWADSHPKLDPELNEFGQPCPGSDRGRVFGAESNPEASEFCPIEFGTLQACDCRSSGGESEMGKRIQPRPAESLKLPGP